MSKPAETFRRMMAASISSLLACLAVSGLAACSSATTSENVLRPADQRPVKSSAYPDFSKPLTSAMAQMSDEEAARMSSQLTALGVQRQAGQISEAEYWRRVKQMRSLAAAE